jgi:hypothetical protein
MRLHDWKWDAEQYRDIDRAAQAEAEAELAKQKPVYLAMRKIGRCANGAERGKGFVYHAVENGRWQALCGAQPGRLSAGWQNEPEPLEKVTCPKCLKKLAAS